MPGSLERIPVKHLGYANSNPLDAMRRSWMMEESGPEGFSRAGALAPHHNSNQIPDAALPKIAEPTDSVQPNPIVPKVLGEGEPSIVEKPRPSIGLGR